MPKINFSSLFESSPENYRQVLLFGNEPFLMERAISFLQKKLEVSLEEKTEEMLLNHSLSQLSLFQESDYRSAVLVRNVSEKVMPALSSLPSKLFIFTSEKARASSKIVTYFATSPNTLAISVYPSPLTGAEFNFSIKDINIPPSFKTYLLSAYKNDRLGFLNIIKHIEIAGGFLEHQCSTFLQTTVTHDDFTTIRNAFLVRNKSQIITSSAFLSDTNTVPLLHFLMRSFLSLLEITSPSFSSWQNLSMPVFFKDQPFFEQAKTLWKQQDILHFLHALLLIECKIKASSFSLPLVRQVLLDVLFHVKQFKGDAF